jgi:BlaI family transcriptional regulator, penicillinase repressor
MLDCKRKKNDMEKLTRKEEQVMQVLWGIGEGFVKDLLEKFPQPKPHYNTVSTIIRILQEKGFVGHRAYGNTHQYFPTIAKEDYKKTFLKNVVKNYFGNSYKSMVSYFAKEENISIEELKEIIKKIEDNK